MKNNFISVGKAKKKAYKITIDQDKTLEEFDVNKFNEAVERMVNRTQASATEMANAGWAFHFMAQRLRARRLEREVLHNVVDEVASREREIEPIDIRDVENLLMFDMEGNEL